jgi:hypothetical protein
MPLCNSKNEEIMFMRMNIIREMAQKMSIDFESMDKKELIRNIQEKEGNTPCFKTDRAPCRQYDCSWRIDCQPGALVTIS